MPQIRIKLSRNNADADTLRALNVEPVTEGAVEQTVYAGSMEIFSTREDCFGDFASISQLGDLVDIDHNLLKKACDSYKAMVSSDEQLIANKTKLIRATHFPVHDLEAVIAQSKDAGSAYVKVYMGVDDDGEQFMFSAPVDTNGNALTASRTLALACVKIPPCPAPVSDLFV